MIIHAGSKKQLTIEALECAKDVIPAIAEIGEGVLVSGKENDYEVWRTGKQVFMVRPVR